MKFRHEFFGPDKLLFASDRPGAEPEVIAKCLEQASFSPDNFAKTSTLNGRRLSGL